jgi:hypothetical protein
LSFFAVTSVHSMAIDGVQSVVFFSLVRVSYNNATLCW